MLVFSQECQGKFLFILNQIIDSGRTSGEIDSSMSIAALVGSLVPMAFARIHIDPAVATGPFVTTAIDIVSVTFYFMIATALLGL